MIYQEIIFPYDYIIIFISLLFIIFSFWKGFIQSLLGLLTWVGSIIITIYSYNNLSIFISDQLIKISFFNNYELLTSIIGTVISIPLIFLISLFVLKKIRKFLSSDLDKQILGIIIDKFFGFIYGFLFSYVIFSTIIYGIEKIPFFENFYYWTTQNSYILKFIDNTNKEIINYFNPDIH